MTLRTISPFQSSIFTLIVGQGVSITSFTIHQTVLARSPVFEAMCRHRFQEGEEKCIRLPEDDPGVIGCLITYLYTDSYHVDTTQGIDKVVEACAQAYIVADKYQLTALKTSIMDILTPKWKSGVAIMTEKTTMDEAGGNRRVYIMSFIEAALGLYDVVPESDHAFREFFVEATLRGMWFARLDGFGRVMMRSLSILAQAGKLFAWDCVELSLQFHEKMKELDGCWKR